MATAAGKNDARTNSVLGRRSSLGSEFEHSHSVDFWCKPVLYDASVAKFSLVGLYRPRGR